MNSAVQMRGQTRHEERSRGAYRPSPGIVYPTLQLLDETFAKVQEVFDEDRAR
jgi:DNA-binding PadR family transcriptional regulator